MAFFTVEIPYRSFSPVFIVDEVDSSIVATIGSDTAVGTEFIAAAITIPVTAILVDECEAVEECEDDLPDTDPPFPPCYPYYGRYDLSLNIKMIRGDTYQFDSTILMNNEPFDLTGCIVRMTAKWAVANTDGNAVFQLSTATSGVTITDAEAGEISCVIPSTSTEDLPARIVELPYDIQVETAAGLIYTVLTGILTVSPDVTITPA